MSMLRRLAIGAGLTLAAAVVVGGAFLQALADARLQSPEAAGLRSLLGLCTPPADWSPHQIRGDESLDELAQAAGLTLDELLVRNCIATSPGPGSVVLLPAVTITSTPTPCGPPRGWRLFRLSEGESLSDRAQRLGVSEAALRQANCLDPASQPLPGARLYAPPTPTPAPTASSTPTPAAASGDGNPTESPAPSPSPGANSAQGSIPSQGEGEAA